MKNTVNCWTSFARQVYTPYFPVQLAPFQMPHASSAALEQWQCSDPAPHEEWMTPSPAEWYKVKEALLS